ncbi:cofactor-independent phosphoglycerate mutase [Candidatus Latescibacterota bacterium]
MKFVVLIGDGMADYPIDELEGKTALEAAETPHMDWIASHGKGGLAQTIPPSMPPGSDVANMEILGYDTTRLFTGRAAFESLSMGHHLGKDDVAFRANLVTLENDRMKNYSADHISTGEARELIKLLDDIIGSQILRFYPGVSYRHLMIWTGGNDTIVTTPPHDIIGQKYISHLPHGEGADKVLSIMKISEEAFEKAIVNKKRIASGKLPATSIWLWGQGRRLDIPSIEENYGLQGGVISAVDLIKGIGIAAGLKPVFVPGATGYIDTNFRGKADAAIEMLENRDFIYVHVEAPDEAAHNGDIKMKIKAIEDFDREVVGSIIKEMKTRNDMAVLVACDHRTPIIKRTHTREPIPFAYYGPGIAGDDMRVYSESAAEAGSVKIIEGHKLMNLFIGDFIPV